MGNIGAASIATVAKDLRQRLTTGAAQSKIDPKKYTIAEVADKSRTFIFDELYAQLQPPPAAASSSMIACFRKAPSANRLPPKPLVETGRWVSTAYLAQIH
jgi:hypothetical protein